MNNLAIPKKMRALQRDRRGYPIPYIVLRDADGLPHFSINSSDRQRRAVAELRCPICGSRLDRPFWFIGGPLSAFAPEGAYLDAAMHHECMTYAVQVCPYLAMANYLGRVDLGALDLNKVPDHMLFADNTMVPERPAVFVAVAANRQTLRQDGGLIYIKPQRPYAGIEYWRNGQRLTEEEAHPIVQQALGRVIQRTG